MYPLLLRNRTPQLLVVVPKRQTSITFKSSTSVEYEYEEFKRNMRNMSKILVWDDEQFGKDVFV